MLWRGLSVAVGLVLCGVWLAARAGGGTDAKASLPSVRVLSLAGERVDPFALGQAKAAVFLFVSVDCPICNSYAPEIQRIEAEFAPRGVVFKLVYPNADETAEVVRKHAKDYGYTMGVLRDPRHALVKAAGARVTPEAAVFVPNEGCVYHGRIDDRHVDFGKTRPITTQHDLKDVLTVVLAGKTVSRTPTPAIGCYIAEPP
jgi:thiol-disulfide isomerase/thioredoxin